MTPTCNSTQDQRTGSFTVRLKLGFRATRETQTGTNQNKTKIRGFTKVEKSEPKESNPHALVTNSNMFDTLCMIFFNSDASHMVVNVLCYAVAGIMKCLSDHHLCYCNSLRAQLTRQVLKMDVQIDPNDNRGRNISSPCHPHNAGVPALPQRAQQAQHCSRLQTSDRNWKRFS